MDEFYIICFDIVTWMQNYDVVSEIWMVFYNTRHIYLNKQGNNEVYETCQELVHKTIFSIILALQDSTT